MEDTTGRARDRYHELLRAQPPQARLAQAMALTKMVRELAVADIREHHPNASEDEIRVRFTVRIYGREVAERLFPGRVPDDARG